VSNVVAETPWACQQLVLRVDADSLGPKNSFFGQGHSFSWDFRCGLAFSETTLANGMFAVVRNGQRRLRRAVDLQRNEKLD